MTRHDDLMELFNALADGTLEAAQSARLAERLRADPEARRLYLRWSNLDSGLRWDYAAALTAGDTATRMRRSGAGHSALTGRWRWAMAAMTLLCVSLAAVILLQMLDSPARARTIAEGGPVAIITEMQKAIWQEGHAPKLTTQLYPGWLKLKSGAARVEFLSGARALLQGETELGISSPQRAHLRKGDLTVRHETIRQPFTLTTEQWMLASDGGLWTMKAGPAGLDLHVIKGSVAVTPAQPAASQSPMIIAAGQSWRFQSPGQPPVQLPIDNTDLSGMEDDPSQRAINIRRIDFARTAPLPYGYQDGQYELPADHEILDEGRTLHLRGNAWKALPVNTTLTGDTVIEFDFLSDREGEIHGFGFDTDLKYSSSENPLFQLYGYEIWPYIGQQFNSYSTRGQWRHYQIRVGRYLRGHFQYLYFNADDDLTAAADSRFRDVRIYESPDR